MNFVGRGTLVRRFGGPGTKVRTAVLSVLALFALVGVLHLPIFRSLLRTAACPFPTTKRALSPSQAEALRLRTYKSADDAPRAQGRPALGFALGVDDRASIAAWSRTHKLSCEPDTHGAGERCHHVRRERLPGAEASNLVGDLGLGYDAQGALVSVQFIARTRSQSEAESEFLEQEKVLARAGAAQRSAASNLSAPWSQRRVLLATRDFRGEVSVTHLQDAYGLIENYQSLR